MKNTTTNNICKVASTKQGHTLFRCSLFLITIALSSTVHSQEQIAEVPSTPQIAEDIFSKALEKGEEFSCSTDIFYHWKPNPPEPVIEIIQGLAVIQAPQPTPTPTPVEMPEYREFFTTLVERGKEGKKTKLHVEKRIEKTKSEALALCRKKHSRASCESSQLQANASRFQLLDFETKRTLQKSILESCKESSGNCISTSNSEVTCEIFTSPDAPLKNKETPVKTEEPKGKTDAKAKK